MNDEGSDGDDELPGDNLYPRIPRANLGPYLPTSKALVNLRLGFSYLKTNKKLNYRRDGAHRRPLVTPFKVIQGHRFC